MARLVAPAVVRFRREHGLDPAPEAARVWLATLGRLIVPLPNFAWRRAIIARHDANHIATGYATDLTGELRLAAWELGRSCYADWRARSLCAALMALGLLVDVRATAAAFRRGRDERVA